jgi:hypothetical protein
VITEGALGNAGPLMISPQQRLLLSGRHADLYFIESELLVSAKELLNGTTIRRVQPT